MLASFILGVACGLLLLIATDLALDYIAHRRRKSHKPEIKIINPEDLKE